MDIRADNKRGEELRCFELRIIQFCVNKKNKNMIEGVSERCILHIKESEGFRQTAYRCAAGVWTCGWGHTKGVTVRTRCSREMAEQWLTEDLRPIVAFLQAIPQIDTQGKMDATADFCFNVGIAAFKDSTLLKKIRAKAPKIEIMREFEKWVYAKGRKLEGLVKRRAWEANRFVS